MSDGTSTEWTDATWNPVHGYSRVSPGRKSCYAEKFAHRFHAVKGHAFEGLTVLGKAGPRWNGEVRFVPEQLAKPLSWKKPFCFHSSAGRMNIHMSKPNRSNPAEIGAVYSSVELVGRLGQGKFSTVYAGICRVSRQPRAVKVANGSVVVADGDPSSVEVVVGIPKLRACIEHVPLLC